MFLLRLFSAELYLTYNTLLSLNSMAAETGTHKKVGQLQLPLAMSSE
jgi:hypothetical protein